MVTLIGEDITLTNEEVMAMTDEERRLRVIILPYSEYRAIQKYRPPAIPGKKDYYNYYDWCKVHGFIPYGGEGRQLSMERKFELSQRNIIAEFEAWKKETADWLDKMVES